MCGGVVVTFIYKGLSIKWFCVVMCLRCFVLQLTSGVCGSVSYGKNDREVSDLFAFFMCVSLGGLELC